MKKNKQENNHFTELSLPEIFHQIHYHLYANSNILRSEKLGIEMVRLLFCKIFDESSKSHSFYIKNGEDENQIGERIRSLFLKVKSSYSDVFSNEETIGLNNYSIKFVVEKLQHYKFSEMSRDVIAEAFQAFWGYGLRGEKGQFFTPRNVVRMCVDILQPKDGDRIIDPACGSGGFLVEILTSLQAKNYFSIFGIDKDPDLVKISKTYMALLENSHKGIYNLDSLNPDAWNNDATIQIKNNSFDLILTNPPFGSKIFIDDDKVLKNYELGHVWKENSGKWTQTNEIQKQVPQILFIERCLQLLSMNGKMAIVLPDGIFGNPSDKYVWEFIHKKARILGIVSLPPETFLPSTHTKTSVLFLQKSHNVNQDYPLFMAISRKIGHDKNGKIIYKFNNSGEFYVDKNGNKILDDDLPIIANNFKKWIALEQNKKKYENK